MPTAQVVVRLVLAAVLMLSAAVALAQIQPAKAGAVRKTLPATVSATLTLEGKGVYLPATVSASLALVGNGVLPGTVITSITLEGTGKARASPPAGQ